MSNHLRSQTMVDRVAAALGGTGPAASGSATARTAIMYAEAIDDDDLGDGLFRFGPGLHTALETLGLAAVARTLLLPRPVVGRLQPVDAQRHLSAVTPASRTALAA